MTCWPRGKEGLPIRNRWRQDPDSTADAQATHKQQDKGAVWCPWVLQSSYPRLKPPEPCAVLWDVGQLCFLPATALALTIGDPCPHSTWWPSLRTCTAHTGLLFWSQSLSHTMPHLLFWAALAVLEVAVLYQNGKGKPTTFFIQNFSQIYRIIAFICLLYSENYNEKCLISNSSIFRMAAINLTPGHKYILCT